ncbi:MAG TPA: PstS family phosphate ABC transporter substrate-binding protein [Longimicrobiales bacterium]|nr:PstS family phosphate ABC transporter substrate-binding protein [Longimicrobiales bacterium]
MRSTTGTGLVVLATLLAACGGDAGRESVEGDLSGSIQIDGSSTVYPITEAVAEEFMAETGGDVRVTVGVSGTGGGFKRFCSGETEISNASRPIKDSESEQCEAAGVEPVELTIAHDGISVIAHPDNTFVDCLTVEELNAIWRPGSTVQRWSDVRPNFPNQQIKLYGAGTDSGTFDYFTEAINGEEDASRSDYTASEDDNTLVQGVAGDPGSLGYFGYAYYVENRDKLKLLGVDSGSGCVQPSPETIRGGTYTPLSRPVYIYVARSALERPEVRAFVDFYLEHGGELSSAVGYVALEDSAYANARARLNAAAPADAAPAPAAPAGEANPGDGA